ncbi:acyl-CoA dehydrogenase family protein [Actinophytocola algeriensis]|uniref:Alkylation response protein AidB-like acyl-CoA dehydrogenase n=1 Tax=Actinophytocola algeriensis TaxID=1768010 RepID=A0A7W7QFR3_9PSEU|nr:alkylation response protein AidB-like acyl-CoA dehydrogenase [Actinophytocola algeriensis]MBE1471997.1 alkylation response protein AidB-like acyl-CoA dehydrogenase [Actinophytocola algeriensis]
MTYTHLSPAHQELRDHTSKVAAGLPAAGEPGRINRPLLKALSEHGLLGRLFPRTSAMDLCVIREALARHNTEAETAFALQGLGAYPILLAGEKSVVDAWMPRITAGEAAVGFALTEPGAGSDAAALTLAATPDGDGYRLAGEKVFISNAPDADVYSVFARTSDNGARGITAFAVPGDAPGLTGTRQRLVSPHPIGRLHFKDVYVPATSVLGEVDGGWRVAMRTLDMFRPSVGAFALGMGQAALDAAVAHTSEREAFRKPLKDFQAVSHQLADVATSLQAARLLIHDAAAAYDSGAERTGHLSAMAKLFATEAAQRAVDVAIQVHGARALEEGHLLEHLYREIRAPRIYEGASEIQREIIARQLYR